MFLVLFAFGAATSFIDAPPGGPTCDYEIDEGSGTAGTGREEIRWGVFPTKYCVGTFGDSLPVEDDMTPFGILTILILPAAAFTGVIVWLVGRYLLLRKDRVPIADI